MVQKHRRPGHLLIHTARTRRWRGVSPCLWWCALACVLGVISGCDRPGAAPGERARPAKDTAKPARIVAHSAGLSLRAAKPPARIVSLAPNLTELLFALGAGPRIVGATRFCDHPPAAKQVPRVGGLIDPDLEAIMAAKPALVLGMKGGAGRDLPARLDRAKLAYAVLEMRTIDETLEGMRTVGALIGAPKEGDALEERVRTALKRTAAEAHTARGDQRAPRVLVVLGHRPMVAAGPGTFLDELLTRAGAVNALGAKGPAYPQLDLEQVLTLDPDHILDVTMTPGQDTSAVWTQHRARVRAVRTGKLHTIQDGALLRPGPRLPRAMRLIVDALYPATRRAASPGAPARTGRDGG